MSEFFKAVSVGCHRNVELIREKIIPLVTKGVEIDDPGFRAEIRQHWEAEARRRRRDPDFHEWKELSENVVDWLQSIADIVFPRDLPRMKEEGWLEVIEVVGESSESCR